MRSRSKPGVNFCFGFSSARSTSSPASSRSNPLLAAALLTLVLGFALIASGIMRIVLAFNMKQESPWVWVVLSGVITLLLGLIIVAHWPVSGLYILGLFLGIDLVIAGVSWIGIGSGLRRHA